MRWSLAVLLCLALVGTACRDGDDSRIRWKDVEAARTNFDANPESLQARQDYVDTLASYLLDHPGDDRASDLYREEEIAYARSLIDKGRFASAVPYYEDAVARAPDDEALKAELEEVRGKIAVSRDRFAQLSKGMTRDEVRDLLGAPRPGWTHTIEKSGRTYETWYYKRTDGGVASVSFAGDTILIAEYGEILPLD
jgi:hypothetical protein